MKMQKDNFRTFLAIVKGGAIPSCTGKQFSQRQAHKLKKATDSPLWWDLNVQPRIIHKSKTPC